MGTERDITNGFDEIIRKQRTKKPDAEKVLNTVKKLPLEHMAEYLGFLEHKYSLKAGRDVAKIIFNKLGIEDNEFIEAYSAELNSHSLERISRLVFSKSDRLLDNYLNTPFPDKIINEYVLLRANQINLKYKGHFINALELIKLGIELNRGNNPEELFSTFKTMKKRYYESNYPPVDINTFFKLVIPILKRCSLRKGPDGFYELRDRIIQELKNDGLTPDQLSIEILDRRSKHRARPLDMEDYDGFELF